MSTQQLDDLGRQILSDLVAKFASNATYGFPGWTCISLNNEIAHGNKTEWNWYYPPTYEQGKLHYKRTWKYEYDVQGNWITKTELHNNVSTCIAKREILYFK